MRPLRTSARAWAEIDASAIEHNVLSLSACAPGSEVCAVVKADGYGHGALTAAAAALRAGATRLAVAQVREGEQLRNGGFDVPIWLMSEPTPDQFAACVALDLEPPVYSDRGLDAALSVGSADHPLPVHLMVDTGMHRVGVSVDGAVRLAKRIDAEPALVLGSVWTHLAVADEPGNPYTARQLDDFERATADIEAAGVAVPLRHAANSAATMSVARSHFDVVRPGVAIYGLPPAAALDRNRPGVGGVPHLRPAMRLWTEVGFVKRLPAGARVSYGLRGELAAAANLATLPIGYADGVRRGWWETGSVLIHGQRCPIVGVVTMDQTIVDCGDLAVNPGDEAVLIGPQGHHVISADEWAEAVGTINYEITCGIGTRVERHVINSP